MKTKNYKTAPNQKIIVVEKAPCDTSNLYFRANIEADIKASINLSANAFLLFNYIRRNQNGYEFGLSRTDVLSKTSIKSDKTFKTVVKELVDKGYLVQNPNQKNHYTFCENPEEIPSGCPSSIVKDENLEPESDSEESLSFHDSFIVRQEIEKIKEGWVTLETIKSYWEKTEAYEPERINLLIAAIKKELSLMG